MKRNQKGFTLVELIVCIVIITLAVLVIGLLFVGFHFLVKNW